MVSTYSPLSSSCLSTRVPAARASLAASRCLQAEADRLRWKRRCTWCCQEAHGQWYESVRV